MLRCAKQWLRLGMHDPLVLEEIWLSSRQVLSTTHSGPSRWVAGCAYAEDEDISASSRVEEPRKTDRALEIVDDTVHRIRQSDISQQAWNVVARLRAAGHEVFLVGGTVRDMILKRPPKDIDLVTSAELKEVTRIFERAMIIGKRFPICKIIMQGRMDVEVSSLSTGLATHREFPSDMKERLSSIPAAREAQRLSWSEARKMNARRRDFTVNALLYDPCSDLLFDYVGGLKDLQEGRLRAVGTPYKSFNEDPARILRAIRFAARVGLTIDKATSAAAMELRESILKIPEARAQLEIHSIFGYGSAQRSLQLMWQHNLLSIVFPNIHDQLIQEGNQIGTPLKNNFLLEALGYLDRLASPDKPVDECIFPTLLAASLLIRHIQKLQEKLKLGKSSKGAVKATGAKDPSQDKIENVLSQSESSIFANLLRGVLSTLSKPHKKFTIINKNVNTKALKLLHRRNYKKMDSTGIRASDEKLIHVILSRESLKWKSRTDLSIVSG